MDKYIKLTLEELMRRKEQILEAKKKKKTRTLYVESLNASIVITEPDADLINDAMNMDDSSEADRYIVYNCVSEPSLRKVDLSEFGCDEPTQLPMKLFAAGEIPQISGACMELAGYKSGSVKEIEEIKNS